MHVQRLQLGTASDKAIFDYAKVKGYAIVSRDIDFYHLSAFYGAPPKVIRIEVGNASSQLVKQILRDRYEEIIQFLRDLEESYLLLR
jgi:predicted nuclease of predicted toxin-antitoxin system